MKSPVFFTGMPGSGKTTIGKLFAQKMEVPFYDLDELIEEREKKSIVEIFSEKGEDYFRKIEHEVLLELLENKKNEIYVLSLGGGTICYFDSLKILKNRGKLIYLDVTINKLVDNLKNSNKNRPLLNSPNEDDSTKKLEELLEKRRQFYNQATIKIRPELEVNDSIKELCQILNN